MCVCVCERERERDFDNRSVWERERDFDNKQNSGVKAYMRENNYDKL